MEKIGVEAVVAGISSFLGDMKKILPRMQNFLKAEKVEVKQLG